MRLALLHKQIEKSALNRIPDLPGTNSHYAKHHSLEYIERSLPNVPPARGFISKKSGYLTKLWKTPRQCMRYSARMRPGISSRFRRCSDVYTPGFSLKDLTSRTGRLLKKAVGSSKR